jgi:hypothetical protein
MIDSFTLLVTNSFLLFSVLGSTAAIFHSNANQIMADVKLDMFAQSLGTNASRSTLSTIPVRSHTFEPRNSIKTKYSRINGSSYVTADMEFNSSSPALHLDNYIEILQIECDNTKMDLLFVDEASAFAAYTAWSHYLDDLVILAGWEHRCHGSGSASTFRVNSMKLTDAHLLLFDLKPLLRSDIVTTWKLNIMQYGVDHSGPVEIKEVQPKSDLGRRTFDDFVQEVKLTAKEINDTFLGPVTTEFYKEMETMRYNKNVSNLYNFTSNYDTVNHKVINPDILVYDFINAICHCLDCYTTGTADIRIEIQGFLADVTMFKFTMKGEMTLNLDLRISLRSFYEAPLNMEVLHKGFKPIDGVLGVFSFGINLFTLVPTYYTAIGLTTGGVSELAMSFGFEVFIPLDVII